jgi:hypothetical protein
VKVVVEFISQNRREKRASDELAHNHLRKGFARGILSLRAKRIGKLYSNTADCIPITYPLFNVRLVEPSQIVLSQVQSLTKAKSFLRPLEAGTNSGYVAK